MEEILRQMGISEKTINNMIEMCENIKELNSEEIIEKINILKRENCDKNQIRNIISSNALYLDRSNTDIKNLINKLKEIGFVNLDLLFDGNPYILNLNDFEIERYIEEKEKNGKQIEDIIDDMSTNLYMFDEI